MTPEARRVSFAVLLRRLAEIRRAHPTWTWEAVGREVNRP